MRRPLALLLAAPLALAPTPAFAAPSTADRIDAHMAEVMEDTRLPGLTVVVTDGAETVHAAGYGEDSRGAPMTADTPMRIASLSKAFTATAVLTLVQDGEFGLDDPVVTVLPEFTMDDARHREITVRQLLNQTSGLTETADGVDVVELEAAEDPRSAVAALADDRTTADPGTSWAYCNANYEIAARLVEVVSGRDFDAFLADRLFAPLGMDDTANTDRDVTPADGYVSMLGLWVPRAERPVSLNSTGSGSVVTTAADYGRWLADQGGFGSPILDDELRAQMREPSAVSDYGLGWGTDRIAGRNAIVHSGNLFTYNAAAILLPETGHAVAVMSNGAALVDETYAIASALAVLVTGGDPAPIGSDRLWTDLVLTAVTAVALVLGGLGVLRARRWAGRRAGAPSIVARLAPSVAAIALLLGFRALTEVLLRRTVVWDQLTYFPASLTIAVAAVGLAGAATLSARGVELWRRAPARPRIGSATAADT